MSDVELEDNPLFNAEEKVSMRLHQQSFKDGAETEAATKAWNQRYFALGPDRGMTNNGDDKFTIHSSGDVRWTRPYFLIPLDEGEDYLSEVRQRILKWSRWASEQPTSYILREVDLLKPKAFVSLLRDVRGQEPDAANAIARSVRALLSRRTLSLIDTAPPAVVEALRNSPHNDSATNDSEGKRDALRLFQALLSDLNTLLTGPLLDELQPYLSRQVPNNGDRDAWGEAAGVELVQTNRRLLTRALAEMAGGTNIISEESERRGQVTDIYVISHGWHRAYFSAVSAYDRLFSRFSVLLSRRRIHSETPYHPLFLMLHWHSDPGKEGWVDPSGRRSRDSFLSNAVAVFQRPSEEEERFAPEGERFLDVFEELYLFFTLVSTSDTPEQKIRREANDSEAAGQSVPEALAALLSRYLLYGAPSATMAEKVTAAWRCFFESLPERSLQNQRMSPQAFESAPQLLASIGRFVLAVVGPAAFLGLLIKAVRQVVGEVSLSALVPLLLWFGLGLVAALVTLLVCRWVQQKFDKDNRNQRPRIPLYLPIAAWAPLEVFCILCLLMFLLLMALVDGLLVGFLNRLGWDAPFGLYDERIGTRRDGPGAAGIFRNGLKGSTEEAYVAADVLPKNREEKQQRRAAMMRGGIRLWFSGLARWPIRLLRDAAGGEANLPNFVTFLDDQFAFWEMQINGVDAGRNTAEFLETLFEEDRADGSANGTTARAFSDQPDQPRLHFIGHSFGGLVVVNAVRHMAWKSSGVFDSSGNSPSSAMPVVDSLCLIQGAIASSWFEREEKVQKYVRKAIVCIFSAYDTANSFYYPLANASRCAAGYLGLTGVGGDANHKPVQPVRLPRPSVPAQFASVIRTPDLYTLAVEAKQEKIENAAVAQAITEGEARPSPLVSALNADTRNGPELVLNLDASRLIFDGPPAAGGGHDDIFKDDVVLLLWAAASIPADSTDLMGEPPDITNFPNTGSSKQDVAAS